VPGDGSKYAGDFFDAALRSFWLTTLLNRPASNGSPIQQSSNSLPRTTKLGRNLRTSTTEERLRAGWNASSGQDGQWAYVVARGVTRARCPTTEISNAPNAAWKTMVSHPHLRHRGIVPGAASQRSGNRGSPLAAHDRSTADGLLRRRLFFQKWLYATRPPAMERDTWLAAVNGKSAQIAPRVEAPPASILTGIAFDAGVFESSS
jgi:hypothetical protein